MSEHDNPLIDVLNQLNEQQHNAAPGNALLRSSESFPVLKAFQDYLESERRKMRQRTTLIVASVAVISLAILVPLIIAGIILFSGVNANQYRLLETMVGLGERQQRPAPALPPQAPEASMAEEIRKVIADVRREMQNDIASAQNAETLKSTAMMLELQAQLQQMSDDVGSALNARTPTPPRPNNRPQPAPQPEPAPSTVGPVRPYSDFPELAAINARKQAEQKEPVAPLALPPGLHQVQPRPLTVVEPRPLTVVEPRPLTEVTPQPARIAAPAEVEIPQPVPTAPLKLESLNSTTPGVQTAELTLPANDGSDVKWRLVIP